MKYCPLCAAEYRQDIELCSSCGAALVASLNDERVRANSPRLLWIGRNSAEFDLVAGVLREASIPALVEEGPTGLLQKFLKSESQVCVLENDFGRALEVAAAAIAGRSDLHAYAQKCHHCGATCSASLAACPGCKATLIVEQKPERGSTAPIDGGIQQESKYCPLCGAEFPTTYGHCTVCGIELVPEELRGRPLNAQAKNERLVIVWRGGDPVAVSHVVGALREAGIRHHVESTHDYLVFGLAMPRPRYVVRVLQSDAEKAGGLLADIADSPFFAADVSPSFPEEAGPAAQRNIEPWNLAAATVEIWSGQDAGLAQTLEDCLRENRIGLRRERSIPQTLHLYVMRTDEAQAREIIREVLESTPPA